MSFYGDVRQTMVARVGVVDGQIVGCGGVAYVDGHPIVFCDIPPEGRRYKVAIVKAANEVIGSVRASGCKVMFAYIDSSEPNARRWVARMGFKPTLTDNVYRWSAD